jgi:glycosyltransferase involved in cell wall biosynthesis
MKVLMLGWEYPPHITGGLGTACEGLTMALARGGVDISFVVPALLGGERAPHMTLIDSWDGHAVAGDKKNQVSSVIRNHVKALLTAYGREEDSEEKFRLGEDKLVELLSSSDDDEEDLDIAEELAAKKKPNASRYGNNMMEEVYGFSQRVAQLVSRIDFDIIHAHDWMTYPAGVIASQVSGKPLVTHVHSLEYDRSGRTVHPTIHGIERLGIENSGAVIAVSAYTRSVVMDQHPVKGERVFVVHNGVSGKYRRSLRSRVEKRHRGKTVLFMGRITFQKGPDYLVEAAAKVISQIPDVKFVIAGTGDMLPRLVGRVADLGLQKHFDFPGFLSGADVEKMMRHADLYVMPSVSEPFGISALEAISCDTPCLISKQSGVGEVLMHALKVDFWDVNRMADLMINALLYPSMSFEMVKNAAREAQRLRWGTAARRTLEVYRRVLAAPA